MFEVIQEMFESPVLDNFYEARSKKLLTSILKENNFDNFSIEDDLLNMIKQLVKNNDEKKQLLEKLNNFEEAMNGEMCILTQNFYKVGLADGEVKKLEVENILF